MVSLFYPSKERAVFTVSCVSALQAVGWSIPLETSRNHLPKSTLMPRPILLKLETLQVDPVAYQKLLDCIFTNDINVCDQVPSGAGASGGAKLINPLGGGGHQVDGADRCVRSTFCTYVVELIELEKKMLKYQKPCTFDSVGHRMDIVSPLPCDILLAKPKPVTLEPPSLVYPPGSE